MVTVQKQWDKARDFCLERGMILASPESRFRADLLYKWVALRHDHVRGYYWLGAGRQVGGGQTVFSRWEFGRETRRAWHCGRGWEWSCLIWSPEFC